MTASILKPFEKKFLRSERETPKSSRDRTWKREREKKKAPRASSNKRRSQYFERRKTL
jgi:hypothetical protein